MDELEYSLFLMTALCDNENDVQYQCCKLDAHVC